MRIVYLLEKIGEKSELHFFVSTDVFQDAFTILDYYKARIQIEFLFRYAKQFLGLNHCQARCSESLHFHFNAIMSTLNLLKLENRQRQPEGNKVISIASWITRKFNSHLLERFSSYLGLDFSSIKLRPDFDSIRTYAVSMLTI